MQNNRAYHQEVMWFQREALLRNRSLELAHTGFGLGDPNIDFAKLAQSMGVGVVGADLRIRRISPARFAAGIEVVKTRRAVLDRRRDAAAMKPADLLAHRPALHRVDRASRTRIARIDAAVGGER